MPTWQVWLLWFTCDDQTCGQLHCNWNSNSGIGVMFLKVIGIDENVIGSFIYFSLTLVTITSYNFFISTFSLSIIFNY